MVRMMFLGQERSRFGNEMGNVLVDEGASAVCGILKEW